MKLLFKMNLHLIV